MTNERTFLLEDTLKSLVEGKKHSALKDILVTMNPSDIAELLDGMAENNLPLLFRLLPKELSAETFVEMDGNSQKLLIQSFSDKELKAVVDELFVDDAVDLVEEMPANVVKRILAQTDPETRRLINKLLQYPKDSAGSIMTTEFVRLRPSMTVAQAIAHIRDTGPDKETVNTCYVADDQRHLTGVLTIRDLILSGDDKLCDDIMEHNVISVSTHEDQENVALIISRYDLLSLPVVDNETRLVGIVTVDDVMDVIAAETTEDMEKMAAITPSDRPYIKSSVFSIWKNRIPWLLLLMISATFTGLIITSFENALASYVVLTAYIPMLMDTGGNSGSQSSTTIIRSLSLNELQSRDLFKVLWKEVRVAVLCGLTLAVVNFGKLMLLDGVSATVAAVVCITLVCTVLVAKLIGCLLPILARRLGFDPAVMAAPILTTIVDALSLLIYFKMAGLLLGF